jgi:uncharacterized protein
MELQGLSATDVVKLLDMQLHPEGGHYIETFRDGDNDNRGACSSIYYLLAAGEVSAWHRVIDTAEIWHWYGGAPLALSTAAPEGPSHTIELGNDLGAGQRPQAAIPANHWQMAISRGAWTLVGCTVSPAFEFKYWELAPEGWAPEAS